MCDRCQGIHVLPAYRDNANDVRILVHNIHHNTMSPNTMGYTILHNAMDCTNLVRTNLNSTTGCNTTDFRTKGPRPMNTSRRMYASMKATCPSPSDTMTENIRN